MIEIAFWGQNQPSFQRASEIIYRVHGIQISYVTVMNITKYIGKIIYDYNYNKSLEIWNHRAHIDMTITKKKSILYHQVDGASVNTRIEDENGSTWRENKLGIFFQILICIKEKTSLILSIIKNMFLILEV